ALAGLSIIIPAWNEEDRLPKTLDRYLPALEARGEPFEIIVVSDGDADRTAEVARRYEPRGVRVLEFQTKLGKGGAVLTGMREARYDCVGYLDADGPIPPAELLRLVSHLDHCDGVVASRWLRGSRVLRKEPLPNRIAGRVWNLLTRSLLFLNIRDTQCGAKFFRTSVVMPALGAIALTNRAFDIDLLYHLNKDGLNLREVPVTWSHDPNTRMPIAKAIPIMFVSLIGVRLMNLPISHRVPQEWVQRASHLLLGETGARTNAP
ncbi:MAG: glycosyltransferase, partial [Nitrososphaerales archaeon]